jgi:hypothetical protein
MPRRGSVPFILFALLFLDAVLLRPPAAGAPIQSDDAKTETSSATAHPVLIELFTSEGCSSCPPADALVQKLDAHQPIPGAQLIVLSEHVDYWDHDGWKDPNSSAALTERQSAYVRALGLSTPYTPQLIVDGTTEVHANEAQRLEQVLRNAATTPRVGVRISELSVDSGDPPVIRAHVDTDTNLEKHNADVFVAVALDHVESQVLHGENGGRRLTHVAVVQQLTRIGKLQKGKTFAEDVQLKLKPGTDPKNVRLIVFVQEGGPGRFLGAALRKPAS